MFALYFHFIKAQGAIFVWNTLWFIHTITTLTHCDQSKTSTRHLHYKHERHETVIKHWSVCVFEWQSNLLLMIKTSPGDFAPDCVRFSLWFCESDLSEVKLSDFALILPVFRSDFLSASITTLNQNGADVTNQPLPWRRALWPLRGITGARCCGKWSLQVQSGRPTHRHVYETTRNENTNGFKNMPYISVSYMA